MNELNIPAETLAYLVRQAYNDLLRAAEDLGEHITWSPLGKGRPALTQLQECGVLAQMIAEIFTQRSAEGFDFNQMGAKMAEYDTPEKAMDSCREGVDELVGAIEKLPDEQLGEIVTLPFGERSYARLVLLLVWNAGYHEGQIVYINSLTEASLTATESE